MVDLAGLSWSWVEFGWRDLRFPDGVGPFENRAKPLKPWAGVVAVPYRREHLAGGYGGPPHPNPLPRRGRRPPFHIFAIRVAVNSHRSCLHSLPFVVVFRAKSLLTGRWQVEKAIDVVSC